MTRPGLLACALALGACVHSNERGDSASIERQLVAQADAWDKAIVRKDRAAIEANVAEGFFHVGGDGTVEDRATFIQDLVDPELVIHPYTVEELTVHLFGSAALLSGKTHMTGTYKGKPFETDYRYIDTYVEKDGRWRVVAVQITKLPPPPSR